MSSSLDQISSSNTTNNITTPKNIISCGKTRCFMYIIASYK